MARNSAAPLRKFRPIGRMVRRIAIVVALLCAAYVAAGLVGGAIPVHRGHVPAKRGIRIYVADNGIHTGIVVPVAAAGVDWRGLIRPEDIADPRYAAHSHLVFGWGDRGFYIGTPTWADLDPATLARAAIGSSDTVLHVEHIPEPHVNSRVRSVVLSIAEYRRLSAFLRDSFAIPPGGGRPASVTGYGPNDSFYSAQGHYDAVNTCNAWTGRALRHAGLRMGAWTPFPVTVMAWLQEGTR